MSTPPSENPPNLERIRLIKAVTNDAAGFLGVDPVNGSPDAIVQKIDATIVEMVFGRATSIPADEEPDLLLASLWGAQMVREFGWAWVDMQFDDGVDAAVVSPERDMVIYPFTFVAECLAKRRICTVELSFNMLVGRKAEMVFPPKSYEDVMMHIHHIIPPYTLEEIG
jgi:hypothetical protein